MHTPLTPPLANSRPTSPFFGFFASVLLAISTMLAGCATQPPTPRPLHVSPLDAILHMEQALHTGTTENQPFHAAVFYPFEHALRYPGLLIGIEQSGSEHVRKYFTKAAIAENTFDGMPDFRDMLLNQKRVMFISHVVKTEANGHGPMAKPRPCFVYNAYQPETACAEHYRDGIDSIPLCVSPEPGAATHDESGPKSCPDTCAYAHAIPRPSENYFANGWLAIDRIKQHVQRELDPGKYTDVILLVMGWNTLQIEAVQNVNSLVNRLQQTAGNRPFRPYVIGVTWPSQWGGEAADWQDKIGSLVYKANDADELGGGWLAAVLEHAIVPTLAQAKPGYKLPLTVIGHSYGARATSHAVCQGGFLKPPVASEKLDETAHVDLLVGLQAAYSLNRFSAKGAGYYQLRYKNGACTGAKRLVLTASEHDSAAANADWVHQGAHFPAALGTYRLLCQASKEGRQVAPVQPSFTFRRAVVTPLGQARVELDPSCTAGRPTLTVPGAFDYIDASALIHRPTYATGGNAHSDIYRTEVARMLWAFMPPAPADNASGARATSTSTESAPQP